jgi:biofilm protein TabA
MIYDLIKNAKDYSKGFGRLSRAVEFINKIGPAAEDGRYDICGDDMYAIVSSYRTKGDDAPLFEAHRKYIDVQCMLRGEERIDVVQGTGFRIKNRYLAKKDVLFTHPPKRYSSIVLSPGYFAIFYPHDLHRPGQFITSPHEVRKLVIKIKAK